VAVKDGVVTLTGFVRSYRQKRRAEADAKRVSGVIGLVNDIEVRLPLLRERPDPQIARDAVGALQLDVPEVADKIQVVVRDGWITLEGEVESYYQREEAEATVSLLRGVRGVTNLLKLKPRVAPTDIKEALERAETRALVAPAIRGRPADHRPAGRQDQGGALRARGQRYPPSPATGDVGKPDGRTPGLHLVNPGSERIQEDWKHFKSRHGRT
jgi:hypothetical protein